MKQVKGTTDSLFTELIIISGRQSSNLSTNTDVKNENVAVHHDFREHYKWREIVLIVGRD